MCQPYENKGKSNGADILPPINRQHTEIAVVNEVFSGTCPMFLFIYLFSIRRQPTYFRCQQLLFHKALKLKKYPDKGC